MNRTVCSFGQGWWERLPARFTPDEIDALQREDDPEGRSRILREFEARSCRPASAADADAAEKALRNACAGDYTSANVILPTLHGCVCHKGGGQTRF